MTLAIALLVAVVAGTSSCASVSSRSDSMSVRVPDKVSATYPNARFAAASAVTSGTVSLGVALIEPQPSDGTTIAVVGWLTSSSDEDLNVYAGKYWELLGFSVIDRQGDVIADEVADFAMFRGGGPTIEQIGAGAVHTRERVFELPGPGRYTVVAYSKFQVMIPSGDTVALDSAEYGIKTRAEIEIE